jgi:hypothetical protein
MAEQVIHIRPGVEIGRDRYNKPIFAETSEPIDTQGIEPMQSVIDPNTGFVTTTRGFTLYLRPTEQVGPADRFTVRGKTYRVTGPSSDWVNPFTASAPGNVVVLEESEYVDG